MKTVKVENACYLPSHSYVVYHLIVDIQIIKKNYHLSHRNSNLILA